MSAVPDGCPRGVFTRLDCGEQRRTYVLDCASGAQLQLPELAYRVVSAVWSGQSYAAVADACRERGRPLSADDVARVYDHVVARIDAAERRVHGDRGWRRGVFVRCTVLPGPLVDRLATHVARLFHRRAAAAIGLMILVAAGWWAMPIHREWPLTPALDTALGLGLFLISCLAHELGHAGACKRFGVRPGAIGVALYLVFPVFFSDVTRVWRLARWQRVTVDVAGLFAQCACGAGYVALFACTHEPAYFVAVMLILAAAAVDLNPLFHFDGYWIVADALGVGHLHAQVGTTLRRWLLRCVGVDDSAARHWRPATAAALAVYSLVCVCAWLGFAAQLVGRGVSEMAWIVARARAPGGWIGSDGPVHLLSAIIALFALGYLGWLAVRFAQGALAAYDRDSGAALASKTPAA